MKGLRLSVLVVSLVAAGAAPAQRAEALPCPVPAAEAGASAPLAATAPALKVASLETLRLNVFTKEEAAQAFFPYRLANAIHFVTADWFVRRELLFREGDVIDPELLAESERRLRSTRLFREALVTDEGGGAVRVKTADAWTLLPKGSFSRKGNDYAWSVGLEEQNLVGTGRAVSLLYDHGFDRLSKSVAYYDPQFIWRYTSMKVLASDLSDGRVFEVGVGRPFYAFAAPWGATTFYRQALYDTKLYEEGQVSTVWKERERTFRNEGGLLAWHGGTHANRLYGLVEWEDVELTPGGTGPPPPQDPRRFLWIGAGVEREGLGWIIRRQAQELDRDEDYNLAASGRVDVAFSPATAAGTSAAARITAEGSAGTEFFSGFALFTARAETRYMDGPRNTRWQLDARAFRLTPPWTFIARVGGAGGWRLDAEKQYYLDPLSGMRGYELHAVSGTGQAVANFEVRRLFFSDILSLISLAAAAFGDAGTSWGPPDGSWTLADAGVGIRFGLTRAAKNTLIRLDFSRAMRRDPQGRGGWLVSFSSGSAF